MSKFKVTATLLTTRTITKVIEANGLDEATKKLLDESKNSKWETRAELKTSAK